MAAGPARADETVPKPGPAKVVVIPIREQIAKPELYILRRGLKEAIENKVDTIVLDMETPGGQLDITFEMLKALEKFPGKTVTYINREAISAGALISAGTDEIYFAPGGVIGAAAPVLSTGGEIDETMRGKIVSYLKARVRSISEGKGYRGEVISAMIDMDSEFKIGDQIIKAKGELLSLTAQEAMKSYGDPAQPLLGTGIANDLGDLLDQLHGPGNHTVQRLEVTWSEKLAQYLTSVTPILLGIGMVCLFIEFKTPGFGIFGISGLTLLGIVFFGQFAAGLSGHEPALVFLLGAALVAVEVFLFPGMLVPAIAGAVLMLGSLVWAMTDLWPGEPIPISTGIFVRPLLSVLTGVLLAVVLFLAILRFLPRGGLWGHMVLDAAVAGEPDGQTNPVSLIGESGVAVTGLFPSGQVEISGRRYEARIDVGHADAGTPVIVTGKAGFSLTVEVRS
jgi:membrane-bound serine protease (ClpP class)